MPDLRSILEREMRTVEAPDDFERLLRRRDRRRRNGRIGAAVLALVLAVFATGIVVRAFRGVERGMPAAPVLECPRGSTPDALGPADQARPLRGSIQRMAFDRGSGQIVLFDVALSEGPGRPWTADVWAFDVCTNRWRDLRSTWESDPSRRGYGPGWVQVVYDADSDVTVAFGGDGSVFAYDLDSATLTGRRAAVPEPPFRLVYDPRTGLILAKAILADPPEMWSYDVETDSWAALEQEGKPHSRRHADHELLAYDPSVDRVVSYDGDDCGGCPGGDRTRILDPRTGVWSKSAADTPEVNTGMIASGGEIAYDEAAGRTVVFSDGLLIAYDAAADRWETLSRPVGRRMGNGPLHRLGHGIVYDPVNERVVVYGGSYRTADGWVKADDVWAFDLPSGEWIQLLAPSRPYPDGTEPGA